MSLKPYPEYKDSGVEFLGGIPSHWSLPPAVELARVLTSTVDKKTYENEIPVQLCNYTDVYYNDLISSDAGYMRATASQEQVNAYGVRGGDVPFTKDSESADDIGVAAYVERDLPGVVYGYHLSIYRPHDIRYGKYLKWLLDSKYVKATFEARTPGVTRVGLSRNTVRYLRVPTPPSHEASLIAGYLDRETAEIDAFIADQKELIALLTERRVATISHAVTKGLDSSATTKDSGVEWLGRVPAEWQVTKVSRHFEVVLGKMLDSARERVTGAIDMPYVRAGNIQEGGLNLDSVNEMPFTPREATLWSLKKGDLLVVEGGAIGVNVVLAQDMDGWAFQKTVNRVRPITEFSTRFLGYALDALRYSGALDMIANKSTIAHFTAEKLEGLRLGFPSPASQIAITEVLDRETAEVDAAIADAQEVIALSKERRAALISAAVTGKIDVRNHGGVE